MVSSAMSLGTGPPKLPVDDVDLKMLKFVELEKFPRHTVLYDGVPNLPTPQMMGIEREADEEIYKGGEKLALKNTEELNTSVSPS